MDPKEHSINILIVEDHVLVADGLRGLLETQADFKVTVANDKNEALRYCRDSLKLDLILMDIELPNDENGLNLTRAIKEEFKDKFPKLKVMMCTVYGEPAYKQRAREMGAVGFIAKAATSSKKLLQAIRAVYQGGEYWPGDQNPVVPVPRSPDPIPKPPTPTEHKILKYVARGKTTAQIGIELAMLQTTVSVHRKNIKQKNNLTTNGELILHAGKCMDLYGAPPDPEFCSELEIHRFKFKTQTKIDIKFDGKAEGFDNRTTCALLRVLEETLDDIRRRNSAKNVVVQLKQDSYKITLTIYEEGKNDGEGTPEIISQPVGSNEKKDALEKIVAAIGGELEINPCRDDNTTVIATFRNTARR